MSRILIVEDDRDSQTLMEYLLRARGHEPVTVANGSDGVAAAAEGEPELILMDIQMPGMDGYEATAAIREAPGGRDRTIIAVTAFAMVGDRERILRSGFDGYITKPIMPGAFADQVEAFLPSRTYDRLWS